jgi:hypothetical protein
MEISENELRKAATKTERPIAGESLTNDPSTPLPFEKPPKFTSKEEAVEYFFDYVTAEDRYFEIINVLDEGVTVMELVELILVSSFRNGEINPDLMMLIAEPLAYILISLAEKEGIRATIVKDSDDPEVRDIQETLDNYHNSSFEEEEDNSDVLKDKLQTIKTPQDDKENPMQEKIDNLPSLMSRGEK